MNPILTARADIAQGNPADLFITRMARADGCPECVTNYETPSSVWPDPPHGFIANYVCGSCGHAWTTSWRDC